MVDAGYLKVLVDFEKIGDYWTHMIEDFPQHPAGKSTATSIPLTLYGNLFGRDWVCILCTLMYFVLFLWSTTIPLDSTIAGWPKAMKDKPLMKAGCRFISNRICALGSRIPV